MPACPPPVTCSKCHQALPPGSVPSPAEPGAHLGLLDAPTADGWLVANPALRFSSPFCYPAGDSRVEPVDLVGMHYSATPVEPRARELGRLQRWFSGKGRRSSTHFAALRDGTIVQGLPLGARAWHIVDGSPHEGRPVNYRSIGIDFMNAGWLKRDASGVFRDSYGSVYTGPQPVRARDHVGVMQWWEPVTDEQVASVCALLARLGHIFPALTEPDRLIYHSDVQPTRSDPGPSVDRAALARALRGQ